MSDEVMSALMDSLAAFSDANSISLARENVQFIPVDGTPYLRGFLLPSASVAGGCGTEAKNVITGIFQVDAVYPINKGWGPARTMAKAIVKHFKRGTYIGCVRVMSSLAGRGMIDGSRYFVPVSVRYRAEVDNE